MPSPRFGKGADRRLAVSDAAGFAAGLELRTASSSPSPWPAPSSPREFCCAAAPSPSPCRSRPCLPAGSDGAASVLVPVGARPPAENRVCARHPLGGDFRGAGRHRTHTPTAPADRNRCCCCWRCCWRCAVAPARTRRPPAAWAPTCLRLSCASRLTHARPPQNSRRQQAAIHGPDNASPPAGSEPVQGRADRRRECPPF